jgi:GTP:adenosylcobinamide-phosphate guanylyltransferase
MIASIFKNLIKTKPQKDISAKALPGTNKKSFSMYFGGGEIWFEHLDGMHSYTDEVKHKFIADTQNVIKPSAPSLIAVNLDETVVNEEIIDLITDTYIKNTVYIHKVVFVGLDRHSQKLMIQAFKKRQGEYQFAVNYINDFEKAKEWLVGK